MCVFCVNGSSAIVSAFVAGRDLTDSGTTIMTTIVTSAEEYAENEEDEIIAQ